MGGRKEQEGRSWGSEVLRGAKGAKPETAPSKVTKGTRALPKERLQALGKESGGQEPVTLQAHMWAWNPALPYRGTKAGTGQHLHGTRSSSRALAPSAVPGQDLPPSTGQALALSWTL